MNNNNRGNNRRRGRGGNRQQGGGQQLNRIDSRARGNAPQLLEKYRKLAHDAHLNGDRVQEEYYLQFADHYFRVLADARVRQEEQREQRQQRWQEGGGEGNWREEGEEQSEYAADGEFAAYDPQPAYQRRDREDRYRDDSYRENRPSEDPRSAGSDVSEEAPGEESGEGAATPFEPAENPFVRENRGSRGLRPRREDRRPRAAQPDRDDRDREEISGQTGFGLDPASLPPAISAGRDGDMPEAGGEAEDRPRRRTRRPRPPADDTGEALEAVN